MNCQLMVIRSHQQVQAYTVGFDFKDTLELRRFNLQRVSIPSTKGCIIGRVAPLR